MKNEQQQIFGLIKSLTGQANILTCPRIFIDLTGDMKAAIFLSQCVYWNDRAGKSGGWFYKTAEDWKQEIGLTRHEIDRIREDLAAFIETDLRRANGSPTLHYRVKMDELTAALIDLASREDEAVFTETAKTNLPLPENPIIDNRKMDPPVIDKTLTETTTETKTETNSIAQIYQDPEKRKERLLGIIQEGYKQHQAAGGIEAGHYPADVKDLVITVSRLFNLRPPERGKQIAFWINGARDLMDACGGRDPVEVLTAIKWDLEHNTRQDLLITSPASLVNMARAKAGSMSAEAGGAAVIEYDPNEPGVTPFNF